MVVLSRILQVAFFVVETYCRLLCITFFESTQRTMDNPAVAMTLQSAALRADFVLQNPGLWLLYGSVKSFMENTNGGELKKFIIPLPGGGGKEVTKSKESEFVITDKKFYQDLFKNIQEAVDSVKNLDRLDKLGILSNVR